MNPVLSNISLPRQEASRDGGNSQGSEMTGVTPAALDDFVHELRQPLSAIESLAYYLELSVADKSVLPHLKRIRALVDEAHGILERGCLAHETKAAAASY